MVVISALIPEFKKQVDPEAEMYDKIQGKYSLVGYVFKNPKTGTFYYVTYVRDKFRLLNKQGYDESIIKEASSRYKAFLIKASHKNQREVKFYGCDAKIWYQRVIRDDSWYKAPEEDERLGNIPLSMLEDMNGYYKRIIDK